MAAGKTLSAREAAWKTLNAADIARHDTAEVLGRYLDAKRTPSLALRASVGYAGQATDIVMGVVRLRGTIDRILRKCASLDEARVKESQWNLLRMGVYELVYCPKTAEYAIVNETAQLAGKGGTKKAVGFINAVLRNVQRAIESRQSKRAPETVRRLVPQDADKGCLFKADILPDPTREAEQYLSAAYSMPQPLVHAWMKAYGQEQTERICIASNRSPGVTLQLNTLRADSETIVQTLRDESIELNPLPTCGGTPPCKGGELNTGKIEILQIHGNAVSIRAAGKLSRSKAFLEGRFFVQDGTAALTVDLLSPQPGWVVLDLCSAPGGKAAGVAMRMRDEGVILASDIDAERLERVRENARRLGLQCIEIVPAEQVEEAARKQERLDAIVLDVPCSNTGVLARRVEARWRWSQKEVEQLVQTQRELLEKAATLSRAGTRVLYSTCSIQPEENERQVEWFLEKHQNFKLEKQQLTLPAIETAEAFDHDGGFAAVLLTTD